MIFLLIWIQQILGSKSLLEFFFCSLTISTVKDELDVTKLS